MVRHLFVALCLALSCVVVVVVPQPALSTVCSQAQVFTTGMVLTATVLNANPSNFVTCFQNIDNTNIGPAGIYASQIIPTNTTQATFGGTISYQFPKSIGVATAPPGTAGSIVAATSVGIGTPAPAATGQLALNSSIGADGATPPANGIADSIDPGCPNGTNTPACAAFLFSENAAVGNLHATSGFGFNVNNATCSAQHIARFFNNGTYEAGINCSGVGVFKGVDTSSVTTTSTFGGPVESASLSNSTTTQGYVPPYYTGSGTATASTAHCDMATVTATGASTTVTPTGSSVFTTLNMPLVIDTTSATLVTSFTAYSATSVTFNSTNGHVYSYLLCGV